MATTTATTTYHDPSNSSLWDTAALLGRIFMAYLFIPAGWGKIAGFTGVAGYIASKGLPMPEVLAALTIVVEIGLGLLLLVGWKARWAALGLALFVVFLTPIFHAYWAVPEAQQMMQKQSFDKNLAIVGGLLFLTAFGAGGFSVDGRRGQA